FVSQGLSLPEASRAVSRSFSASSQAIVTRKISERIEAGTTLGRALASSLLSDGICRPILFMMDQRPDLAFALQENAQLLGRLVDRRCRGLSAMVPVFMLLGVGAVVWSALTVYFLGLSPMITMISMLATWQMQWAILMISGS
ncbi:MAG: type II secretion system F family protein, partial [Planctomycetota bacterium]